MCKRDEFQSLDQTSFLVGRPIQFQADISKTDLKVGQSATLTVQIKGNGNIREAQLSPNEWTDVKIYDDQPTQEVKSDGTQIMGVKTFKRAIVPTKEGTLTLSPIQFVYLIQNLKVCHRSFKLFHLACAGRKSRRPKNQFYNLPKISQRKASKL